MRRVAQVGLIVVALLAAYVAWPIYTALKLREAMVAGDSAALAARIDWGAVRSSLKASMSAEAMARLDADPDAPAPTKWQRIKQTAAPRLGGAIDRYVTTCRFCSATTGSGVAPCGQCWGAKSHQPRSRALSLQAPPWTVHHLLGAA